MQGGPPELEARFLQVKSQIPGDLKFIPQLRAQSVSTLDTGSPTILSGWDATTDPSQQIATQTLVE